MNHKRRELNGRDDLGIHFSWRKDISQGPHIPVDPECYISIYRTIYLLSNNIVIVSLNNDLAVLHDIVSVTETYRCCFVSNIKKTRCRQFSGVNLAAQGCHQGLKLFPSFCCVLHTRALVFVLVSGGCQVATASVSSCTRQEGRIWAISTCPFTSGEANLLQGLPIDFASFPLAWTLSHCHPELQRKLGKRVCYLGLGILLLEDNQFCAPEKREGCIPVRKWGGAATTMYLRFIVEGECVRQLCYFI